MVVHSRVTRLSLKAGSLQVELLEKICHLIKEKETVLGRVAYKNKVVKKNNRG